ASTVTTSPGDTAINRDEKNPPCRTPVPHFTKPPSKDNHGAYAAVSPKSGSGHLSTGEPGSAVTNGFTGGAILSVTTRSGPRQNGVRKVPVTPTMCLKSGICSLTVSSPESYSTVRRRAS